MSISKHYSRRVAERFTFQGTKKLKKNQVKNLDSKMKQRSFFAKRTDSINNKDYFYGNLKSDNTCEVSICSFSGVFITGYRVSLLDECTKFRLIFTRKSPPSKILAVNIINNCIYFYEFIDIGKVIKYTHRLDNLQIMFMCFCDFELEKTKYSLKVFEVPQKNYFQALYFSPNKKDNMSEKINNLLV